MPRPRWQFLFNPDFSRLTPASALMALGQALFSISVGTGAIITYGAYLKQDISVRSAAWTLGIADTSAALLAGLAIFPIVFAAGPRRSRGAGPDVRDLANRPRFDAGRPVHCDAVFCVSVFCRVHIIPGDAGALRLVGDGEELAGHAYQ